MPSLSEKELLNKLFQESGEKYPVIDAEPSPKIEKDVQDYIEKVEKEQFLSQPITDDYGQPIISPPASQDPKIVLPITQNQYLLGLQEKITESIRWLAVWCGRLVKIFGQKAVFRKVQTKT